MNPEIKANITIKADATEITKNLLQKIANAIGFCFNYEATQITRKANAEAKAKLIKTQADIEVKKTKKLADIELNDIQQRGMARLVYQEERKQANIENIIRGALPLITENTLTEEIDEDWIAYFFAHCDTVSDCEMQSLWSNILANEASNPSKFSKRTIDFVSTISKEDAKLITNFCQFVFTINGKPTPVIDRIDADVYRNKEIFTSTLYYLDSIGLIKFQSYNIIVSNHRGISQLETSDGDFASYFDKPILYLMARESFPRGNILFTQIGEELASICGAQANVEFYEYIKKQWADQNLIKDV